MQIALKIFFLLLLTCSPTGPGGPGNPLDPSSPFCPNRPCWPLGPGSPSAPWRRKNEKPDSFLRHRQPRHHDKGGTEETRDTYSRTRCSDGSLRASGTWWALRWGRGMSTKTFERIDHRLFARVCFSCFSHSDLRALLCRLCFPSGRALRSLPARVKHNHSMKNASQRQREISRDSEQR